MCAASGTCGRSVSGKDGRLQPNRFLSLNIAGLRASHADEAGRAALPACLLQADSLLAGAVVRAPHRLPPSTGVMHAGIVSQDNSALESSTRMKNGPPARHPPTTPSFLACIETKRDGKDLATEAIEWFVREFTAGRIPDYQMAAMLMAIFFRGMTGAETRALTLAMRDSGEVLKFPADPRPIVDKHSTGGVGDKVSLPLAPLLACLGFRVPMISGRGLGITGGTLDKLESIPGFTTQLETARIIEQVQSIGVAMAGQTGTMVPADKKLYALRDVTGTVPSIPLITASILSKKLAEGLHALIMDVKFGAAN